MYLRKQFVLLSGGLDSSTVAYYAKANFPLDSHHADERVAIECVSIDYGQRHSKEMAYAADIADSLGAAHVIIPLGNLLAGSMLTDKKSIIPNASYADLPHGVSPTYVPFRNGLMLSILAAHAQKWVGSEKNRRATIYIGAHSDDAANDAYPDCGEPFLNAMRDAIHIGTYGTVALEAPLAGMQKGQVVKLGAGLGVPFEMTWSCYKGEQLHCGTCPTCRARREAFAQAGVIDPTTYA